MKAEIFHVFGGKYAHCASWQLGMLHRYTEAIAEDNVMQMKSRFFDWSVQRGPGWLMGELMRDLLDFVIHVRVLDCFKKLSFDAFNL